MNLEIFAVYDSAAERYLQPFFGETVAVGVRKFEHTVNHPQSAFSEYPADYTLFHIGTFDQESGSVQSFAPRNLGNALQFQESVNVDG